MSRSQQDLPVTPIDATGVQAAFDFLPAADEFLAGRGSTLYVIQLRTEVPAPAVPRTVSEAMTTAG
jgi:hypothetical protein